MKVIALLLVVLVSSSTFASPNRRQSQDPPLENVEDEVSFEEEFEKDISACERHLKCQAPEERVKRQETVEEDKTACERLLENAEEVLRDEAERSLGGEENESDREELVATLEECRTKNDVDCDGGSSNPEARFLRRMLRNLEGDDCLKALDKVKELREGEDKCKCEGGKGKSGGEGRKSGDGQRPRSKGGDGQRPGSKGGDGQRPGSKGGDGQRPGSDGGDRQRPGSKGGDRQRPGSDGGDRQKQGSDGADRQGNDAPNEQKEELKMLLRLLGKQ